MNNYKEAYILIYQALYIFAEENSNRANKSHVNDLITGQVAVFPQGYIHYEQNLSCNKTAIFISALNHEDPGLN